MAASVYVIDSAFKRTQVKVTPGKYLREVLEEACKSRKLNPEAYSLKTQGNKVVDLSQPFRLSGLTAGAKLQLVQASRSPSVVSVVIQLPEEDGAKRLSDKFASNTSLWAVLRRFEEGVAGEGQQKFNFTQQGAPSNTSGAGRLLYRQPCLNAMGRTLDTFEQLQKTLGQLGFSSGSVLLRLSYKDTERPLEEAMVEISQYFDSSVVEAAPTTAPAEALPIAVNAPDSEAAVSAMQDVQPEAEETSMDAQPRVNEEQSVKTIQGMSVYLPPSSTTPAAALQAEDPTVFEPTVDDARAHQASLTKAGRNTRLLSDKELEEQEAERQAKLATVQQVDVRVRYPDQSMIETTFHASDTAAALHSKVRDTLRHSTEPFELRFAGNKGHQTIPDDASKRLIKDLGFRGKVLVTILWGTNASAKTRAEPSLQDQFRAGAQELKVNLVQQSSQSTHTAAPKPAESSAPSNKPKGDLEAKMKKFLGFKR